MRFTIIICFLQEACEEAMTTTEINKLVHEEMVRANLIEEPFLEKKLKENKVKCFNFLLVFKFKLI